MVFFPTYSESVILSDRYALDWMRVAVADKELIKVHPKIDHYISKLLNEPEDTLGSHIADMQNKLGIFGRSDVNAFLSGKNGRKMANAKDCVSKQGLLEDVSIYR